MVVRSGALVFFRRAALLLLRDQRLEFPHSKIADDNNDDQNRHESDAYELSETIEIRGPTAIRNNKTNVLTTAAIVPINVLLDDGELVETSNAVCVLLLLVLPAVVVDGTSCRLSARYRRVMQPTRYSRRSGLLGGAVEYVMQPLQVRSVATKSTRTKQGFENNKSTHAAPVCIARSCQKY